MKKYLIQFNLPSDSDLMTQTLAKGLQGFLHRHKCGDFDWRKRAVVPFSIIVELTDAEYEQLVGMGRAALAKHIAIEMGQKIDSIEISPYEEL